MAAFGVMVTERILGEKVTNFFRHRNEENSLTLGSIVNANPNIHLANKPWGLTMVGLNSLDSSSSSTGLSFHFWLDISDPGTFQPEALDKVYELYVFKVNAESERQRLF